MNRKKQNTIFFILCAGIYYLLPYVFIYTASGDKTDALLGVFLALVPLALFMISVVYGALSGAVIFSTLCAAVLTIPYAFVGVITGRTLSNKLQGTFLIMDAYAVVSIIGAVAGLLIRKVLFKFRTK